MAENGGPKAKLLSVNVVGAKNLRKADLFSDSDPYCIVELSTNASCDDPEVGFRTRVIDDDNNPVWNHEEILHSWDWDAHECLRFTVYDKDFKIDECIGTAIVRRTQFQEKGFTGDVPLHDPLNTKTRPTLTLQIGTGKQIWGKDSVQQAAMAASSLTETQVMSMRARKKNQRLGIVTERKGPNRTEFRDFIRTERDRTRYCSTMPFTAVLAAVFSFVAFNHGHVVSVNRLRRTILKSVQDIEVPQALSDGTVTEQLRLDDISNTDEMWSWVADGLVPRFGGAGPGQRPGFVGTFNRVVGAVQLRQWRKELDECTAAGAALSKYVRAPCRSELKSVATYGPIPDSETNYTDDMTFRAGGGLPKSLLTSSDVYFAFLPPVPPEEGTARARYLRAHRWCDSRTRWVEIRAALFNGEVNAYILVSVLFDFEDGGSISKHLEVSPVHVPMWTSGVLAWDIVWFALMLVLLLVTVQEAVDGKQERIISRLCASRWMALDWLGSVCGVAVVGCFMLLRIEFDLLGEQIRGYSVLPHPGAVFSSAGDPPFPGLARPAWNALAEEHEAFDQAMRTSEGALSRIIAELSLSVQMKAYHRIGTFGYVFFILLRFFRGCIGQPYFGSMLRTLSEAAPDVVHLAIILLITFENFVLSGCIFFGSSLKAWSSVNGAHRSALAVLSGIGDFASMYERFPFSATIWLFGFALTVLFVASNMLFAIMIDHFAEVREAFGQAHTSMLSQGGTFFDEFVWSGQYRFRRLCRKLRGIVPASVNLLIPYYDMEPDRLPVPYDALLCALEPAAVDEAADPNAIVRMASTLAEGAGDGDDLGGKRGEDSDAPEVPAWTRGQPGWAPIQHDVLVACGCDTATADRLLRRCSVAVSKTRPKEFPTDLVYHEFKGQARLLHEMLSSTDEDLRNWLSDRARDCSNLEPRQRKLEALAVEKIMPRTACPPMLLPPPFTKGDEFRERDTRFMLEDPNAGCEGNELAATQAIEGGPRSYGPDW